MVLRNIFHASGSLIPIIYFYFGKKEALFLSLTFFLLISLIEFVRIKGLLKLKALESFIRERERKRPTGSFFFTLASSLVILLFEERIAIPSLLVVSFSDPFAAYVGKHLGKKKFKGRSVEGSCGFFLVTLCILLLWDEGIQKSLIVSFISALTEFFSVEIDDNLTVPLSTALCLRLINF
jgi:dolichol kinase